MEAYEYLSLIYDEMMSDVDYHEWASYIDGILKTREARSVYEAACGTGKATLEFFRMGYDITASDISRGMLNAAAASARRAGCNARFVLQDMREIEVGNKADAVISVCDGPNYLDEKGFEAFALSAYRALKDNGVLLFDISSKAKLKSMDGEVYFDDRDDASCIWQSTYDSSRNALVMDITLFVRRGELFERLTEQHVQYAHEEDFIRRAVLSAGFKSAQALECLTSTKPRDDTQRIQFVCVR